MQVQWLRLLVDNGSVVYKLSDAGLFNMMGVVVLIVVNCMVVLFVDAGAVVLKIICRHGAGVKLSDVRLFDVTGVIDYSVPVILVWFGFCF